MLLMSHFEGQNVEDKVMYFMSLDHVKFRRPVVPGDQIRFELEMLSFRGKACKLKGEGYVEGQEAAEAELMAMVGDKTFTEPRSSIRRPSRRRSCRGGRS